MATLKLPDRRQFLHLAAGAVALPMVARIARAQAYPARPVRIIVPFAAGGGTDIVARMLAQKLEQRLGKSFVIDDFRSATTFQNGRETKTKLREQDKGQKDEVRAVCAVVREGKPAPIALDDLATTTRATFRVLESLRTGLPVEV